MQNDIIERLIDFVQKNRKNLVTGLIYLTAFVLLWSLYSLGIRHYFGTGDPAPEKTTSLAETREKRKENGVEPVETVEEKEQETLEQIKEDEPAEYKKPYLEFVDKVYQKMDEKYYKEISRETYKEFLSRYTNEILPRAEGAPGMVKDIAHLGAGLMVTELRDAEDNFTNFIPPDKTEEYKQKVYSYEHSIGIEGTKIDEIFFISDVEVRSPAYKAGIRPENVLLAIEGASIADISEEEIKSLLHPEIGEDINLLVAKVEEQELEQYTLTSEKFYKEALRKLPTPVEGILYLEINAFNKKTEEDLLRNLSDFGIENIRHLVLDVRDNPGGPPLAVRNIASIFLGEGRQLVYYERRNTPEAGLVTETPEIRYDGPMSVVVNEGSGSSAELLAGTLQAHGRALIAGTENTAGFAFLKGLEDFEDGSSLAMVTGWAYLHTGEEIGMDGIQPNIIIPEELEDNVPVFVVQQIEQSF